MASFILRDLPEPLWSHVLERGRRDGWPTRALILQLLEDYATGTITPSGSPPPPKDQTGSTRTG